MHISYAVPLSISLLASSIVAQSIVSVDVVSYPASVASSNIADVAAATQAPSAPLAGPSPPYANSSMPSILPSDNSGNSLVGSQKIWAVKVGSPDGKFVFSPEVIFAQPGELVQFQFYARVRRESFNWTQSHFTNLHRITRSYLHILTLLAYRTQCHKDSKRLLATHSTVDSSLRRLRVH